MFYKEIDPTTAADTVIGELDCTKTRRAAFQLLSDAAGTAKIVIQGSIDKKSWVTFGTMSTKVGQPEDGGNAEFIWPYVRCKVEEIGTAKAYVSIITRV